VGLSDNLEVLKLDNRGMHLLSGYAANVMPMMSVAGFQGVQYLIAVRTF